MGLEEESRFARLGVSPPTGVLLYGPSGCGKTALGLALAQSTHATFIPVNVRRACVRAVSPPPVPSNNWDTPSPSIVAGVQGAEVVHKVVGESEKAIAQVFARARAAAPAILFIDQIDMLARPRGADSSGTWNLLPPVLLSLYLPPLPTSGAWASTIPPDHCVGGGAYTDKCVYARVSYVCMRVCRVVCLSLS